MKVELAGRTVPLGTLRQGDTFLLDGLAYCVCHDAQAIPGDSQARCFRFDGALLIPISLGRMVYPRPMKVVDDVEARP